MIEQNSAFQINDVLLDIAPENISINHTAQVKQYSALRTRGTAKVRSPSSVVEVLVQTKFVGADQINKQLRPLLAQLRLTPFCFVENQFLRDSLVGQEDTKSSNIALVLQNLTISTVQDLPDALNVMFSFLWFNYKPYSKDFSFKTKLFEKGPTNRHLTPGSVNTFGPFQLFYNNELGKLRPISLTDSYLKLTSLEFLLTTEIPANTNNADLDIDLNKLRDLESEVTQFIESAPDLTQYLGTDATQDLNLKQYLGRLSGNVTVATVNEVNFALSQYLTDFKTARPNDAQLSRIVEAQKRIAQKVPTIFNGAVWLPFPDINAPNNLRGKSSQGDVVGKLFYRQRVLDTAVNTNLHSGIVATAITINFNHKLAIIPMQGYQYPTAQSFGPSDIEFTIQIACLDDDSNRRLTSFWNANQNGLQYARAIPQDLLNILVDNELFGLVGVQNVLLTAKRETTIPDQPGMYSHELVLTSNDFSSVPIEQFVAQPTSFKKVKKLIWDAIWNNLISTDFSNIGAVNFNNQEIFIRFEGQPSLSVADRQFLNSFGAKGIGSLPGLNSQVALLIEKISKTTNLDIKSKFSALQLMSGITDNQVLGIEGLTNALYEISPKLQNFNGSSSKPISEFNQAREERDGIKALLQGNSRQREERLRALRNAITALDQITTQANANDGIKSISPGLIITTNNGTTIDLASEIKDPVILEEIRNTVAISSVPDTSQFDDHIDRRNRAILKSNFPIAAFRNKFQELKNELNMLSERRRSSFFDLFNDWGHWANIIADEIIDKYIGLSVFKAAKEELDKLETTTQGSLYRDMEFEKIRSDVLEFAGASGLDEASIELEPDFYFWNESIDGFSSNPLTDMDIQKIKGDTIKFYDNAHKDKTNWYQRKYLQKVNPQFKDFLDQSRDNNIEDTISIDTNRAVLPGLAQLKQAQLPQGTNAFTRRLKGVENLRTTINAPVDSSGKKIPLSGDGVKDFVQGDTSNIASQPSTPEQMLEQSIDASLDDKARVAAYGGWINPLPGARISSIIGFRKHPIHKTWSFHTGTDLTYNAFGQDLTTNMPVFATLGGEVLFVGHAGNAGNMITIRSETTDPDFNNVVHRYMHLAGFGVTSAGQALRSGDLVNAGDIIGFAGNTGASTGAHLHFDVHVESDKSTWIYPFDYREEFIQEVDPDRNSQGYTVLRRPTFIPITGTNPSLPSHGVNGFATGLSLFDLSTQRFQYDQQNLSGYRMNRAYPTIYLALIEEDLDAEHIYKFDDYFSFSSIVSLYCVKDREVPADYALMELTNLSGLLSNRKFQGTFNENDPIYNNKVSSDPDRNRPDIVNTDEENQFESLMLREGIKVEIRLGFANEPKNNEIVFIGRIVGVQFSESDDVVQVEMQSLATELVQDIKGLDSTEKKDGLFFSDARTGPLLEELIASPECVSFGFWTRGSPDKNTNRDLLTDRWTWNPAPSSDNIFAPVSDDLDPRKFLLGESIITKLAFASATAAVIGATTAALFGASVFIGALSAAFGAPAAGIAGTALAGNILDFKGPFSDLSYYMYQSTIWDVFKEMEHRHPDCISSPVPYIEKLGGRTRMTMFFGNPDWLYFARDPRGAESLSSASKKQQSAQLKQSLNSRHLSEDGKLQALKELADAIDIDDVVLNKLKAALSNKDSDLIEEQFKAIDTAVKQRLLNDALMAGAIRPFRNYHLVTSKQHIVANNIKAKSSNVFNAVTIRYADSASKVDKSGGDDNSPRINSPEELTMKLDPLIPDEFIREAVFTYPNCQGDLMAKRYAISHLQKACWSIYQGDLVILGNPRIKPYDIVFIHDEYTDMHGPVQVRRVTHMFDMQHGFLTIITPDLVTTVTEGTMLSELQAMGLMAERYLGFEDVLTPGTNMTDGVQINPLKAFAAKTAMGIGSFFGAKKLIFVTQFGNPVRIHPLIKQGQAMVAGFGPPGTRENEFIINDLHQWINTRSRAIGQTIDDFTKMFNNRQGILNTRGSPFAGDDLQALATRRISE
jgi:murein DD-endopeptidase MepM/ murein hydrolase activator NlpD